MGTKTYVALFSGINVGGNRSVQMVALRDMLTEMGYEGVATLLQSGNAVFRTDSSDSDEIAARIETDFVKRFGFVAQVIVRNMAWVRRLVAGNPFPDATAEPTKLHAFALRRTPTAAEASGLTLTEGETERFRLIGDVLYVWTPDGFGRSRFINRLPRMLRVPATARNWRTVAGVLDLCEAVEVEGRT
jgi:uncharacterized protein (DUF1697 family)